MKLSDLQEKDVISVMDGQNLGKIIDADINELGVINYFIVLKKRFFWQIFSSSNDKKVYFNKIKKIGHDVILVEL